MLSQNIVVCLSALTFRSDAERKVSWIPFFGIFWEDELPEMRKLMTFSEEEQIEIFRLFALRLKMWRGESLNQTEQDLWDSSRLQIPDWPLFQRLEISEEDMRAQEEAERNAEEEFSALFADADEVTITEKDGVQKFSATFKITDEKQAAPDEGSWWQRILRKLRRRQT